jgi:two-component system sensor histidine kinase/response regulator
MAAANGEEAVRLLERDYFDLVLMDLQMPVMDGLQATAQIREREKTNGRHVPIIAMTAHAMKGDHEHCLRNGMDAYLTKPLNREKLFEIISRYSINSQSKESTRTMIRAPERNSPAIDRAAFLERIGGDQELALELIDLYVRDSEEMVSAVSAAVKDRNLQSLERAAHKLKGALGTLGAKAAADSAWTLETMARNGDVTALDDAYARLASDIAVFEAALAKLRHEVYRDLASPQCSS